MKSRQKLFAVIFFSGSFLLLGFAVKALTECETACRVLYNKYLKQKKERHSRGEGYVS